MRPIFVASLMIVVSLQPAYAETGSRLREVCASPLASNPSAKGTDDDVQNANHCIGYMTAIDDMSALMMATGGKQPLNCPPNGVTISQLIQVTEKWLNDHPEKQHLNPASLVLTSLAEAFPCP